MIKKYILYICTVIINIWSMKTNVTMVSEDRTLFGVIIKQDTKTSFMSLTDLQEAYTRKRIEMGWSDKRVENILSNKESIERVYYIINGKYVNNMSVSEFKDMVDKTSLVKTLKDLNLYRTTGRGADRDVMCIKELWMMVAMELNPMMYMECMNFINPEDVSRSVSNCIEHGDIFLDICKILKSFGEDDRIEPILNKINVLVTGEEKPKRYSAKDLSFIKQIQLNFEFLVESGFVGSISELEDTLDPPVKKKQSFCYTYIAVDDLTKEVKIGQTFNVKKRESTMKTSNPRIKIIAFSKEDAEKEIHAMFNSKRIVGEWFKLSNEDINYIIEKYHFNMM